MLKKLLVVLLMSTSIGLAYILDGTVTPTVIYQQYQFSDGDSAVGMVYFRQGFNVPAGATVNLDISTSIDGPINLNGTGYVISAQQLRIGPKGTGFPQGGRIKGPAYHTLRLSNDITIGGQLEFFNSAFALIDMQGNAITLLDDGVSRGSFMIKYTDLKDGDGYADLQLDNGTVFGLEDFKTGYGPRIRSYRESFRPAVWLRDTTVILAPDSTMTVTGYNFGSAIGNLFIKTPSTATLRAFNPLALYEQSPGLYLSPGIKLIVPVFGNDTMLSLDNATLVADAMYTPLLMVQGKSYLTGTGNMPFTGDAPSAGVTLASWGYDPTRYMDIDIAGGATLVVNKFPFFSKN